MGRLDVTDKYRDATERRKQSRRWFNSLNGRRANDKKKERLHRLLNGDDKDWFN